MLLNTGSYRGNGARKFVQTGFRPKAVLIKSDSANFLAFHTPEMWCGRSNALGAQASYNSGIRCADDGFYVGSSALCNASGATHHYVAIGDDGTSDVEIQSWAGNAADGRQLALQTKKTPIAALIKRDSNREAAFKAGAASTVFMGGTAASDCIAFSGPGQVTLSSAVQVNEWDSVGGLGEGIDGLFVFDSGNATVVSWVGNGQAGRVIQAGLVPAAALIGIGKAGVSSRLITDTMGGKTGPVNAAALQANEGSIVGNSLVIGSSPTALNESGIAYSAVFFAAKQSGKKEATPFKVRGSQAVYLPANGIASYISCGASDNTLKITGEISYEFFGAVGFNPTASPVVDNSVIARGAGPYGNANGYSWSLLAGGPNDGNLGWANAQWAPQLGNVMALAAPLDSANWRTGLLAPHMQLQHVVATLDAAGNAYFYVNGELQKQKKTTLQIASVAGHETVIGARKSTSSYVRNTRMLLKELAIYSRALTLDEVRARFLRAAYGSKLVSDVTAGRAAWWHADNASATLIPDVVDSANDGTIAAGQIITL